MGPNVNYMTSRHLFIIVTGNGWSPIGCLVLKIPTSLISTCHHVWLLLAFWHLFPGSIRVPQFCVCTEISPWNKVSNWRPSTILTAMLIYSTFITIQKYETYEWNIQWYIPFFLLLPTDTWLSLQLHPREFIHLSTLVQVFGLVPSGNKLLPELLMTKIYDIIRHHKAAVS